MGEISCKAVGQGRFDCFDAKGALVLKIEEASKDRFVRGAQNDKDALRKLEKGEASLVVTVATSKP